MKVEFFFDGSAKFTATEVTSVDHSVSEEFVYTTRKVVECIQTDSRHTVPMYDVRYIVIHDEYQTTIVPGTVRSFYVEPSKAEQRRILNNEVQFNRRVAASASRHRRNVQERLKREEEVRQNRRAKYETKKKD